MFEGSISEFASANKKITKQWKTPVTRGPLYRSSQKLCVLIRQWNTSIWIAVVECSVALIVIKFRTNTT